nr:immunoglobulin heavy chain junction region [Macaca mulatta]MOX05689.1 immunoglobulin heavy chain junction region [Macaca mulatta]MOX06233.1 immunoglobulin heavy chain junction region [Macaca mulatta]
CARVPTYCSGNGCHLEFDYW